jgi:hypothetical protein
LIGGTTSRAAGVVLLAAFAASMYYLLRASKDHDFLGAEADEIAEEAAKPLRWCQPVALTVFGLAVITVGAELVSYGAEGIIRQFAFPAALMGMIITPAAIEAEEVIRQAVPAKQGRYDVAAGNLIGTVLYFVLFNLGLIAVAVPVPVAHRVVVLDWPLRDRCHLAGHRIPMVRPPHPRPRRRAADRLRRLHRRDDPHGIAGVDNTCTAPVIAGSHLAGWVTHRKRRRFDESVRGGRPGSQLRFGHKN